MGFDTFNFGSNHLQGRRYEPPDARICGCGKAQQNHTRRERLACIDDGEWSP